VSERTIYRDLADLAAQGAPIQGEAGAGYVLRPACDLLRWKICNIHAGPFMESWAQRIAVATIHHMQSANTFLRRFEMLKHP
jgi:HTH domain